ncbi:hypothetical protein [Polaromonas sp. CG_9.11]|uniref:hypothetical protein n=1 Tax=Polaromonas sp. CG_9.11 TaxID=2787730 RepID=UPI0018CBC50B|nr:hypothetical protein [Polaromonas sp. CG_9.11]
MISFTAHGVDADLPHWLAGRARHDAGLNVIFSGCGMQIRKMRPALVRLARCPSTKRQVNHYEKNS